MGKQQGTAGEKQQAAEWQQTTCDERVTSYIVTTQKTNTSPQAQTHSLREASALAHVIERQYQ